MPIDPGYPKERVDYLLDDSQVSVILTNKAGSNNLTPNKGTEIIYVDRDWHEIMTFPTTRLDEGIHRGQLAYVIYTSGSTGQPKGVMIEHGNVSSFIHWCHREFASDSFEVLYATTSVCFDLSVFEIWYPLTVGKKIRLIDDGTSIQDNIAHDESIFINTVPSVVQLLLQQNINWDKVNVLNMAGEPIPLSIQKGLPMDKLTVRNLYGPSETTTYSTCYQLTQDSPILIGQPVGNAQIALLDKYGNQVPVGVAGEIHIAGTGVARGYLNQEELTKSKFITYPNLSDTLRWYKTGDIGRWLSDGNLEYLGRTDDQVKVRGFRIELGEVESVLLSYEGVEQAVVLAKTDVISGNKQLVGYVIGKEVYDQDAMIQYLSQRLPNYMIPSAWVVLEEFPLTPNGKIDKNKLPSPDATKDKQYEGARNKTEEKLIEIWAELLGIETISINDNFFELGGHSLMAVRMLSLILERLRARLELKHVFITSSLWQLANFIDEVGKETLKSIPTTPHADHHPLSPSQKRLWLIDQMYERTAAYNVPLAMKFTGFMDISRFERAFKLLVLQHESLRTVFRLVNGEPRQFILQGDEIGFGVEVVDARTEENPEQYVTGQISDKTAHLFDLSTGPLIISSLFILPDNQFIFFVNMHHIISDSWSVDVIMHDLRSFYSALERDSQFAPIALPIHFKDYCHWLADQKDNSSMTESREFWKSQFSDGVPSLELQADRPRPSVMSLKGDSFSFAFEPSVSQQIRMIARREKRSLFSVLMAMVKILLYRYSSQTDVLIGTPVSGRNHADLEKQVGFYLNTILVRTKLDESLSFDDNLTLVAQNTAQAMEYMDYPYDQLVEDLSSYHSPNKELFNVLMSLDQKTVEEETVNLGLEVEHMEAKNFTSKFELSFLFTDTQNSLACTIEYHEIFDRETIQYLASGLQNMVRFALESGEAPISSFDLVDTKPETKTPEMGFDFS